MQNRPWHRRARSRKEVPEALTHQAAARAAVRHLESERQNIREAPVGTMALSLMKAAPAAVAPVGQTGTAPAEGGHLGRTVVPTVEVAAATAVAIQEMLLHPSRLVRVEIITPAAAAVRVKPRPEQTAAAAQEAILHTVPPQAATVPIFTAASMAAAAAAVVVADICRRARRALWWAVAAVADYVCIVIRVGKWGQGIVMTCIQRLSSVGGCR